MLPALLLAGAEMGIGMWEQAQQAKSNRKLAKQIGESQNLLEAAKGGIASAFDVQEETIQKEFQEQSKIFNLQTAEKHQTFTDAADFNVGKSGFAGGGGAATKKRIGTESLALETRKGQFALQSDLFRQQKNIMSQEMSALGGIDEQIQKLEAQKASLITEGPGLSSIFGFAATVGQGLFGGGSKKIEDPIQS